MEGREFLVPIQIKYRVQFSKAQLEELFSKPNPFAGRIEEQNRKFLEHINKYGHYGHYGYWFHHKQRERRIQKHADLLLCLFAILFLILVYLLIWK